jgi:hypothetical protein
MKKQILVVGIILVLLACGLTGCMEEDSDYINTNIPSNFLYQNKNETIPNEYKINGTQKHDNGELIWDYGEIYAKHDSSYHNNLCYYCNDTDIKAERIEYFRKSSGYWYYRFAIVCGDSYWIVDANAADGSSMYGPF